ncbi:hypothetical protein, partial [Pseudomonas fluvialis]|uniref:hypothetical protein n=1 Tax=Pseudomonas fluvialis TaxID=1793966 RepID=UPI001BB01D16
SFTTRKLRFFGRFRLVLPASLTFFNDLLAGRAMRHCFCFFCKPPAMRRAWVCLLHVSIHPVPAG